MSLAPRIQITQEVHEPFQSDLDLKAKGLSAEVARRVCLAAGGKLVGKRILWHAGLDSNQLPANLEFVRPPEAFSGTKTAAPCSVRSPPARLRLRLGRRCGGAAGTAFDWVGSPTGRSRIAFTAAFFG